MSWDRERQHSTDSSINREPRVSRCAHAPRKDSEGARSTGGLREQWERVLSSSCFLVFSKVSTTESSFSVVEKCKGMCVHVWVLQEHLRDKTNRWYKKKRVHLSWLLDHRSSPKFWGPLGTLSVLSCRSHSRLSCLFFLIAEQQRQYFRDSLFFLSKEE